MNALKKILSEIFYGKTNVFGSYSDQKFDDLEAFKKSDEPFVTSVKVWEGDVIDCIEFVYGNRQYEKGKSPFFHGGKNGVLYEFKLGMGDFITKIEGEYGRYPFSLAPQQQKKDVIIRLRFTTHQGKTSRWFGNACGKGDLMKGTPFIIDAGRENIICGLYGATWTNNLVLHNYVQAIGAYYMTWLDAQNLMKALKK